MAAPCGWTITKCGCGACWDTYTPMVKATASALATMIMWAATGRQFGRCQITVQPCARKTLLSEYQTYPVEYGEYTSGPYISGGVWYNDCSGIESTCSCSVDGTCSVLLEGPTTTAGIVSIMIAGVALPATSYVVVNGNTLIRTDGQCWPSCPSLTNQTIPAFEVTYLVGLPIPDAVQAATERLACELAKACTGGPCVLPQSIKSLTRQGVEVAIESLPEDPNMIRTGIKEVDLVIMSMNPYGLMQRPTVLSLDMPMPRRVS
jgi:hypothetical protein